MIFTLLLIMNICIAPYGCYLPNAAVEIYIVPRNIFLLHKFFFILNFTVLKKKNYIAERDIVMVENICLVRLLDLTADWSF